MILESIRTFSFAAILAGATLLGAAEDSPQAVPHYSNKQLRFLMATASHADEFQKLASYFHYQELVFRTKAQKMRDEYASYGMKYPMATKNVSRVEIESRLYEQYSARANENATLAAKYDELLIGLGVTPARVSATRVSARSLETTQGKTQGTSLVEKNRPAGN